MKKWMLFLMAVLITLVLAACGGGNDNNNEEADDQAATETDGTAPEDTEGAAGVEDVNPPTGDAATDGGGAGTFVTVDLINSDGDTVGTAELTEEDNGVHVKVNAEGLEEGDHGIHFHEFGKCDAPDFESAGEHFNPTTAEHGSHAGDLPNLTVDQEGKAEAEFTAENVTLESGQENSLFKEGGTALVIHEKADDGTSQPSGDSGNRIACGVVKH